MKISKLKLLIGILGYMLTPNTLAATLTLSDNIATSSIYQDNYIASDATLKKLQLHHRGEQYNYSEQTLKETDLNIWTVKSQIPKLDFLGSKVSANDIFSFTNFSLGTSWLKESSDGLKLKMRSVTKSKYWIVILAKSSLSIRDEVLPPVTLALNAMQEQDGVRICSKGLTLSTFSGREKVAIKRFLNRHSRYLC